LSHYAGGLFEKARKEGEERFQKEKFTVLVKVKATTTTTTTTTMAKPHAFVLAARFAVSGELSRSTNGPTAMQMKAYSPSVYSHVLRRAISSSDAVGTSQKFPLI